MRSPTLNDVKTAAERIRGYAHRTPVLTSQSLDRITGKRLFFKCENFQRVGAFKFRGAMNAVLSLAASELQNGVATHSSGNHAQALALAARQRKVVAHIVMPKNAPKVKKTAVLGYGGRITLCEPTQESRHTVLNEVLQRTGATLVHPYDDPVIVAGQGTAALELFEEVPDLDVVMAPVGGGGLLSGTVLATRGLSSKGRVVGAEPAAADDAYRSLQAGRILPSVNPNTLADGLLTSLGEVTFPIIQQGVDAIVTVGEDAIVEAMRLVWERMKILIEPSAAVPLAALVEKREEIPGHSVGLILSGGNVDLDHLPFRPAEPTPA